MSDIKKLKDLSVDDLLQELRTREAKAKNINLAIPLEPSENLREFDDESIANVLKENQKVIYGMDDRVDVFQLPAGPNLDDVDSVVALFQAANITDNGNGTSTLRTQNFGAAQNLCAGERFSTQPIGAFCSGFLVASNIIATAGHCANAGSVTNIRFVFGFRMRNATTAETVINNGEIYRGVAIIGRQEVGNGADWALVRIDRPVTNHRIVRIRRTGKIVDTQAVHVIGHPVGLPTKFAGGAVVRNNLPNEFFVANLDTYGGNSGSPVFNSNTHEVEGILVRGENDFVRQGNCMISLVCPSTGCRGEDCTRTTEFSGLISNLDDTGKTDIAVLYDYPNSETGLWLFTSDSNFQPNQVWSSGQGNWEWSRSKVITGDFQGSGKTDIAVLYDYPNSETGLWLFTSDSNFQPNQVWSSGQGNWEWSRSKVITGDYS
jgi:Trypsin-like peptidase domain